MANEKIDEIRKGFAERLKLTKIDDSQSLKDLGLDSLDVVEMCLDLEDKYQIQFTTEELSSFKTIGDLLSSIEKKLAEKK
ncbi:MAG: acyl carrier protein [Bacilli bacterium]